jgi:hypothetical protein
VASLKDELLAAAHARCVAGAAAADSQAAFKSRNNQAARASAAGDKEH